MRALLVDDDDGVRESTALLLERLGFSTDVYADAREALGFLKYTAVDVIFTDVHMPRMDGLEFLRRVRLITAIPVVVVSGSIDVSTQEVLALGGNAFLPKPYDLRMLEKVISETLDLKKRVTSVG